MTDVIVKMSTVFHSPNEPIPGLAFKDVYEKDKIDTSMLGYEIFDYEKVCDLPTKGYRECRMDDYRILYDVKGLSVLYGTGEEDPEHTVYCITSFCPVDENGKWIDDGTEYRQFKQKDYEKFCELFEKNKKLYYPTC